MLKGRGGGRGDNSANSGGQAQIKEFTEPVPTTQNNLVSVYLGRTTKSFLAIEGSSIPQI